MKNTAIAAPLLQLPSWARLTTRLPDFVSLMKPRVMSLAVFTALVGMLIAPGHLDPLLGSVAILAIAAGAGAAGVLNMWYDVDVDAVWLARPGVQFLAAGSREPKRWRSGLFLLAARSRFLLSRSMSRRQPCSPSRSSSMSSSTRYG